MKPDARVVLDTNVVVSALLLPNSNPAFCVKHVVQHGVLVVTEEVFAEYVSVLNRNKLNRYVSRDERERYLEGLAARVELVQRTREIRICRDSKEDKFLEAAVCGEANAIVTGDGDLLALSPFEGIQILAPADFLEELEE